MQVRIRLGAGIAPLAPAPVLTLEVPSATTVAELCQRLADDNPELGRALSRALPIVGGVHADRSQALAPGDEVALLTAVSGG